MEMLNSVISQTNNFIMKTCRTTKTIKVYKNGHTSKVIYHTYGLALVNKIIYSSIYNTCGIGRIDNMSMKR